MSRFTALRILEKRAETPDTFSLILEKPTSGFSYLAGQYLTVRVSIEGQKHLRAYSLSSSPYLDPHLQLTIKRLPNGLVSNYIWERLQVGDTLEVFPPLGRFTVQPQPGRAVQYLLIAAGSGIAPIWGILRSILFVEPKSRVRLLYGNREERLIIFREALDRLVAQYEDRLEVLHTLSRPSEGWTGQRGRISPELIQAELQRLRQRLLPIEAYICGPGDLITSAVQTLEAARLPKERIHTEFFTAPLPAEVQAEPPPTPEKAYATIRLDGKTYHVEVAAGQTLLAAAQAAGMEPPYACEEGICCTCRAKLYKGQVHMAVREALSDWEIEKGYILTCQAVPLTPEIEIEYG
ncbi:MAG: ferredoxin--NADP reductase [Bacteroidia bacterium]